MPADALSWLLGLEQFGIKLGLHNITAILEALGNPQAAFRAVHVAGTNGKGSVTAMIDTVLRAEGYRSARYTSPHLVDLTERFVVDGLSVGRDELREVVGHIRTVVDRLLIAGTLQVQPTFFEVTTAAAFQLFRRAAVDIAVCEVGLGGRLDATNVLDPLVAIITTIGFDHRQHLGSTLAQIATEKAGIIKPQTPVIVGRIDPEASAAIRAVAAARDAEVIDAWTGVTVEHVDDESRSRSRVRLRTPIRDYGRIEVALPGAHQVDNAVVAVRALETLDRMGHAVSGASIVDGLAKVKWPGRLDWRVLPDGRELLLDAAHNPDGAAALAAFLTASRSQGRPIVFAAMRDKDVDGILHALAPVAGSFVMTRASHGRSADPAALADSARIAAPSVDIVVEPRLDDALATAWRVSPTIVVTGSIFLLGDVINHIDGS
jgi:dihydrofolate synthase/folylpolyglutamate synthase